MSPDYEDMQTRLREAEHMWGQIAHERVKERLDRLFAVGAFRIGFGADQDEAYKTYSEQASKLQNSTSRIAPRELEEAVFSLEDNYVQRALEIYCDETPERQITDLTLLWVVYNMGLIPFVETRILRDTCFKLDHAQPSLGLNILRPDGERFFSYGSDRLKREFPIVIRIVDRLKTQCSEKIAARVRQITDVASDKVQQSAREADEVVSHVTPPESPNLSASVPVTETPIFTHSDNYDSVTFNGESYTLQERQAAVVKMLHEAVQKGHPAVPGKKILNVPGCEAVSVVRDIFKSRPQLWGTLIVNCEDSGEGRGFYRLSIAVKP
jgi:hypothetical protein